MHCQQMLREMTVTGFASMNLDPSIVKVQLDVITENKELTLAQQENADTMNHVIQALLQVGITRENIQTTTYTIHPEYDYVEGEQKFRGYKVVHEITVKIMDINQAGTVIDVAVQNGINRVSNIQFTVKNRQMYYTQALSKALENAYEKAQALAGTMQLGPAPYPVMITENINETPSTFKTFSAAQSTTPIEPGQIAISASITTKFHY